MSKEALDRSGGEWPGFLRQYSQETKLLIFLEQGKDMNVIRDEIHENA